MAWQMNKTKSIEDNVKIALAYFEKKYGKPPTSIVCNPDVDIKGTEIAVRKYRPVMANILMIGEINEKSSNWKQ